MARRDPALEWIAEFLHGIFFGGRNLALNSAAKNKSAILEEMNLSENKDIESKKADFAIKLDVESEVFERAWAIVEEKHPELFPKFIELDHQHRMSTAITKLIESPKRLVTKKGVAELSGLPLDRVSELWPKVGKEIWITSLYEHRAHFEDDPRYR